MTKMIKTPSTKLTEDHDAVVTELTLDFSGLSVDDVYEIAAQAAVIKWQGNARRGKEIPKTATYVVPKPGTRSQVDPIEALTRGIENGTIGQDQLAKLMALMQKA